MAAALVATAALALARTGSDPSQPAPKREPTPAATECTRIVDTNLAWDNDDGVSNEPGATGRIVEADPRFADEYRLGERSAAVDAARADLVVSLDRDGPRRPPTTSTRPCRRSTGRRRCSRFSTSTGSSSTTTAWAPAGDG